jgi:hypothetical protein
MDRTRVTQLTQGRRGGRGIDGGLHIGAIEVFHAVGWVDYRILDEGARLCNVVCAETWIEGEDLV